MHLCCIKAARPHVTVLHMLIHIVSGILPEWPLLMLLNCWNMTSCLSHPNCPKLLVSCIVFFSICFFYFFLSWSFTIFAAVTERTQLIINIILAPFLDVQKFVSTLRWRTELEWYNFQAKFGSYGWYPLTQPPRKKRSGICTYFIAQSFCPQALSKPAANVDTIPQDDDSDDEVLENAPVAEVPAVPTRGVLQRFKDMMGRSKDRWGMGVIWIVEINPKRWVLHEQYGIRDLT